ncbi:MAG: hypothetical protein ACFB20_05075 [Opitutales bacterium]
MTPEEAKKFLQAYRPSGADAEDADMRAALESAQADDALKAWHDEESAFDKAFAAKLRESTPPADLKERILAAAANRQVQPTAEAPQTEENVVPFQPQAASSESGLSALWSRVLPLAASLILLVGLAFVLYDPGEETGPRIVAAEEVEPALDALFTDMVHEAEMIGRGERSFHRDYRGQTRADLHLVGEDLTAMKMEGHRPPAPQMAAIPDALEVDKPVGCRAFIWNGRAVGSVCIGERNTRHLYWGAKDDMDVDLSRPILTQRGEQAVGVWAHGDQFYVLVIDGTVDELEELLMASEI